LRPGEKLHEVLSNSTLSVCDTKHPKIYKTKFKQVSDLTILNEQISLLLEYANKFDNDKLVRQMKKIVPEFKSINSTFEILD
ncbi:MAG: polysaccharide biosynthesis protein, partial [Flavobacteriaceae bacterium]|nr:polysaccharide biosynthesis protein [Flavobacteriaceae bacterium]